MSLKFFDKVADNRQLFLCINHYVASLRMRAECSRHEKALFFEVRVINLLGTRYVWRHIWRYEPLCIFQGLILLLTGCSDIPVSPADESDREVKAKKSINKSITSMVI